MRLPLLLVVTFPLLLVAACTHSDPGGSRPQASNGRMTTRNWPERGQTQVLVVDRLEEAPRKEVAGAR